jgi:hypothetical protein
MSRLITILFQYCLDLWVVQATPTWKWDCKRRRWNSKSAWSDRSNPSISWEYHSVSSFLPKSVGRVNAFDLRVSFLSFIWWRVQTLVTHREDWPQSPNKMALQIGPGSSQSESYNAAASTNLRLSLLKAKMRRGTCDVLAHGWEAQCTPSKLAQNKIGFTACWWKPLSRTSKQPTLSSLTGHLVPSSTGKSLQST